VVNSRQGANSDRLLVKNEAEQLRMKRIAFEPAVPGEPRFFQNRKRPANIQAGNYAPVAVGRVDRRGIRDRVDGSDKDQQAKQPDGIFKFQRVPES
jgi:hypothetical protein